MSRDVKLSYNDVSIVPAVISTIKSRTECNPCDEFGRLPIFVSPMDSVINEDNYDDFARNNLNIVVPRTVSLEKRIKLLFLINNFVAFSLNEAKSLFVDNELERHVIYDTIKYGWGCKICIDLANGHMKDLLDTVKAIKMKHPEIIIMTGNIANPKTYVEYEKARVDYVRVLIGSGDACFVEGTKITMADGSLSNIEDIDIGEYVMTMEGPQKVTNCFVKETQQTLIINNEIECTPNHEFFVVKKNDVYEGITDEEIKKIGFYVKAEELSNEYLLVQG